MFQGDWEKPHQQEKWAVRGKAPDCPFLHFVYTNALLANAVLFHQKALFCENDLIYSDRFLFCAR